MRGRRSRNAPVSWRVRSIGGDLTHRFAALDALRGLCAIIVVLFHFNIGGDNALASSWTVRKGWLFVDFFFVLSGFVLAHAYADRLAAGFSRRRFLALRLGRIYPLHLFMLATMVAVELVLLASDGGLGTRTPFAGARSGEGLAASLLLLHSSGFTDRLVWNGPSWSIAAEFWVYALFALTAPLRRVWPFALAGAAALATLLLVQPDLHYVTYSLGTVRCIYGFSIGVLVWHSTYRTRPSRAKSRNARAFDTALETAAIAAVWAFTAYVWKGWPTLLAPPLFAVAVLVFAREAGWISRLLRTRPLLAIGTWSYAIYMIHIFVQARLMEVLSRIGLATTGSTDRLTVSGWQADAITLAMLALVITLSALTHRWIERPARNSSRRRLLANGSAAAA